MSPDSTTPGGRPPDAPDGTVVSGGRPPTAGGGDSPEPYPARAADAGDGFDRGLTPDGSVTPAPDPARTTPSGPATPGGISKDRTIDHVPAGPSPSDGPQGTMPTSPGAPTVVGPHVPGYEILGTLGRGGMGVVYRARDARLNRVVALKMVLAAGHAGEEERDRFQQEAEAVARLQHPNIVQIFEVGEADGLPFCALEFCPGGTLGSTLRGEPQDPQKAAGQALVLARAMDVVHAAGMVHRDLKPANVLLTADGTPKITDFGLAKRLGDESSRTQAGQVMGTPSYMAPEQARGEIDRIGPVTDVWALGAILYEMLIGRPPFRGTGVRDTLDQVLGQDPVPVRRLAPRCPRDLETVCHKCLEKDPARRYPTAAELAEDLGRFLDGRPVLARRAGPVERAVKWAKRSPLRAALSAAAAALVVVGATAGYVNAELARRTLDERNRQDGVRAEIEKAFGDAERGAAAGRWAEVEKDAATALALLGSDAAFGESPLRGPCEALRDRAPAALRDAAARRAAAETLARLRDHVDDAVFHRTIFTGLQHDQNADRTHRAVAAGLALFGITPDGDGPPAAGPARFSPEELAAVRAGCGELLLLDADALAQARPGEPADARRSQLTAALARLARAEAIGFRTHAGHRRRAAVLADLGDPAADAARAAADAEPPAAAADLFLTGLDHFRAGDYPAAARLLAAALRAQPEQFGARYVQALCYLQEKKWANARDALTACTGLRPDFPWPYLFRGFAASELGEFATADADFDRVLGRPAEPVVEYVARVNRGVSLLRRSRWAEAVADLEQAIALRPDDPSAYVNLALARRRQAEPAPARELAVRLVPWPGPPAGPAAADAARRAGLAAALADLDRGIGRRPDVALLHHERGRLRALAGDAAGAREDFTRAVTLAPPTALLSTLADDLVELGRLLHQEGDHARALAAYDAALAVRPDRGIAHRLRAEPLLALGRLGDAAAALDRFLAAEADTPARPSPERVRVLGEAHRARGALHARGGNFRAAVESYTRGLQAARDPETLALRGWAYLLTQAPRLALPDFEEALALRPGQAHALGGRAECRVRAGQLAEGVADAEASVREPDAAPLYLYRAARVLALAAAKLEDARWVPPAKAAEAAAHRDRAAALLTRAIDRTPPGGRPGFWADYVRSDAALADVRRHPALAAPAAAYDR